MKDWTLDGIHLCNVRLRLLQMNTMPAFDANLLTDISQLPQKSAQLRDLGRLPYPMIRQRGEKGFRRISWDEALEVISDRIRTTTPDRLSFYITSRGTVNETYYATQKAVRALPSMSAAKIMYAVSSTSP
jgi:Molybdopterin oxidoreductase